MTKPTGAILDFLGADHRACDDFFASVRADVTKRSWGAARRQFGRCLDAMLCHLAREEKVLYPRSKPSRQQHVTDADHCRYLCLSETLDMLMKQHTLKEESLLFPMCDQMLDEAGQQLIGAMGAIARRAPRELPLSDKAQIHQRGRGLPMTRNVPLPRA